MLKKFLSIALYALPLIFFIICYFLVVASGEDIFQGANTPPAILKDMRAAENQSARAADM
ncbi:hypothetical protein IJ096_03415 [Candidatus Saccharibacteria bacterium]|nr:hypothetical protein [Candidatus Saccharibacteria bacterium]